MTMAPDRDQRTERPWSDDAPDRVSLPDSGTGERRRRRDARRHDDRSSTGTVVGVVATLLAVLVGLVLFGWERLDDLSEETEPETSPVPDAAAGAAHPGPGLVVHQADDGSLLSVAVVETRDGGGGDIVLLPAGTMVEVPSYGLDPLRQALALGGLPLLQQSVENLFGVTFGAVTVLDPPTVEALVRPAGVLTVELPEPVEEVSPSGRVDVLFPAGESAVPPERVATLLSAPASGGLDRLVRHQAFWTAWLAAIRGAPEAVGSVEGTAGLVGSLPALAAGDVDFHVVPVESVASGLEGDADLWRVRDDELQRLVAEVLPRAPRTAPGGRVRVQVLNGTGEPGLSQRVQPLLVPAGARVTLTGNASHFDHAVTQIVYYDDADLASARAIHAALRVGEVLRSRTRLDVVDVTVVVGADLVGTLEADRGGDGARPTNGE